MEAIRIKQQITRAGITIPFDRIQQFHGKQVEIIILPDTEGAPSPPVRPPSLKKAIKDVFEYYHDVKPCARLDQDSPGLQAGDDEAELLLPSPFRRLVDGGKGRGIRVFFLSPA